MDSLLPSTTKPGALPCYPTFGIFIRPLPGVSFFDYVHSVKQQYREITAVLLEHATNLIRHTGHERIYLLELLIV